MSRQDTARWEAERDDRARSDAALAEVLRENRALRSEVARLTAALAEAEARVWVGRVVGEEGDACRPASAGAS